MKEVKITCAVEITHTLMLSDEEADKPITIQDQAYAKKVKEHLGADNVVVLEMRTATRPVKDWPSYMDNPRNSCAGCVHEQTDDGAFPCNECKRKINGEYDLFVGMVSGNG